MNRNKLVEWLKENKKLLRFFVVFILIIAIYYLIVALFGKAFDSYTNFTAWFASFTLNSFGIEAYSKLNLIITHKSVISLSFGCEGTEPIIIFLAGVLAYPTKFKSKIIGISAGIIILYLLNIIRIIALYFVAVYISSSFNLFHEMIFPVFFILLGILSFFLWLKLSTKQDIK